MAKQLKKIYNSIVYSLGSCLIITGNDYPQTSRILQQSDAEALKDDWAIVGTDIRESELINVPF